MGIVPYGSGDEITRKPIGSGPFRFVSAEPDKDVVLGLNDEYWGEKAHLQNVRFIVVPDTTTRALELRKGSADIAINALTSDMVLTLERDPNLAVMHAPGTVLAYLAFNLRDPILKDERVRQALAYAIDRRPLLNICSADLLVLPTASCPRRAGLITATCRPTTTIPLAPASCSSKPDIQR